MSGFADYLAPEELVSVLQDEVLPTLSGLSEPGRAARDFPVAWMIEPTSLVEWAVALDEREAARLLVSRYLVARPDLHPAVNEGRAEAARGEPPRDAYQPYVVLGRALTALAVFQPDELLPGAPVVKKSLLQRVLKR